MAWITEHLATPADKRPQMPVHPPPQTHTATQSIALAGNDGYRQVAAGLVLGHQGDFVAFGHHANLGNQAKEENRGNEKRIRDLQRNGT